MNGFLRTATAIVLGLALWGIAKANGRSSWSIDQERLERDRNVDFNRDRLRHFDLRRWQFDRDDLQFFGDWCPPGDLRYFDFWSLDSDHDNLRDLGDWWFDSAPDDLRQFDYWQAPIHCFIMPS